MSSATSPTAALHDSTPSLAELAHLCRSFASSSDSSTDSSSPWSESTVFEWAAALDSVLSVHGAQTDWSGLLSADDKQAVLQYAVSALPLQSAEQQGVGEGEPALDTLPHDCVNWALRSAPLTRCLTLTCSLSSCRVSVLRQWLCVLKTISRSRSDLESLYDNKVANRTQSLNHSPRLHHLATSDCDQPRPLCPLSVRCACLLVWLLRRLRAVCVVAVRVRGASDRAAQSRVDHTIGGGPSAAQSRHHPHRHHARHYSIKHTTRHRALAHSSNQSTSAQRESLTPLSHPSHQLLVVC